MARRRREVEVFTTSSLNLLSKALGAVILLFIIIPKVTVNQKKQLNKLPPELERLVCDGDSIKLKKGDSTIVAYKIDSMQKELKRYAELYERLNCLKGKIHVVDTVYKPSKGTGNIAVADKKTQDSRGVSSNNLGTQTQKDDCINDVTPPYIVGCPNHITKNIDGTAKNIAVSWSNPTANDNCGQTTLNLSSSPTSGLGNGSAFPIGVTYLTYTAKDSKGNQNQCGFAVTVKGKSEAANEVVTNGGGNVSPTDMADRATKTLTVNLYWTGDDTDVGFSIQNSSGKYSGYENFNSSTSWFTYINSKKLGKKNFIQKELVAGSYKIFGRLIKGKVASVSGSAYLAKKDDKGQFKMVGSSEFATKTLNNKDLIYLGTLHVEQGSIRVSQ